MKRYHRFVEPAPKLATFAELATLPEDVRAEVIEGTMVTLPRPLPRHSNVQRALGNFIGKPFHDDDGFGGPGGWWILLEVAVQLSAHVVVHPDLVGWQRERLPDPWDVQPIEVVPDWICEVLSPSNAAHDRVTKRRLYARHGVRFYWIIDPTEGTLEALRLEEGAWVEVAVLDATEVARIPPFEAVELPLARLFPSKSG
ncbi:MAG: Uma2 family endonuclease [Polyangiaceae bacterium]